MTGRRFVVLCALPALCVAVVLGAASASYIEEESSPPRDRPAPPPPRFRPPGPHVPELAQFLDALEVRPPVLYRQLAVYPVALRGAPLSGRWLTMDQALARGALSMTERGAEGTVPRVVVENRSRDEHVFLMAGEVLSGGKQTRTLRQDVILAPGQRIEVNVFCVEARRWEGEPVLRSAGVLVPQSIQKEMHRAPDRTPSGPRSAAATPPSAPATARTASRPA